MNILSFALNQDLTGFIITMAVQSILISLLGIAVIKLISRRSAPVRSLACTVVIAALGFVLLISTGLRLSGISWSQSTFPTLWEGAATEHTLSNKPYKALSFETISPINPVQTRSSIENILEQPDSIPSSHSIELAALFIFIINLLGFIWIIGLLFQVIRLGYGVVLVKKFRKNLQSISDSFYIEMVRTVAGTFWKTRIPELYRSPDIKSPVMIGLLNPIIIIPEKLFATLRENELKSILVHELAHIYHYDQFMGVIKRIVLALHWWNPLVYIINKEHEQAREEVSDNYVLRELHPKVYTQCLATLAEKVCLISNFPTAAGMAGRYFDLSTRVDHILSKRRSIVMHTKMYLKIITLTIGLVLTFGIAGLHGKVKSKTPGDELEARSTMNSVSLFEEEQKRLKETIEGRNQDDSRLISNVGTNLQTLSPNRPETQIVDPAIAVANVRTQPVLSNDVQDSIKSAQKESAGEVSPNAANVPEQTEAKAIKAQEDILSLTMNNKQDTFSKENNTEPDRQYQKQDTDVSEIAEQKHHATAEYVSRGKTYLEKGEIDKAVSAFTNAIELNDKNARIYLLRGNAYADKKNYEQAVNDYSKAIELNPEYAVAYNNRGYLYHIKQEYKKAIDDYSKGIKINPEFIYAYYNRGNAYYAKRQYRKAISDYSKIIKINSGFSLAYAARGSIYYQRRSYRKAILDCTKALELNDKDARIYLLRGNAYRAKRKYEQAINDYNKVVELSPEFAAAYINRGLVYEKIDDHKKAIYDYSKVIEIDPENIQAYLIRGEAYSREKHYDKAISDYSKVIEIAPDFALAYTKRGDAYYRTGQYEKEKNDRKMASKLDSQYYARILVKVNNDYQAEQERLRRARIMSYPLEQLDDYRAQQERLYQIYDNYDHNEFLRLMSQQPQN